MDEKPWGGEPIFVDLQRGNIEIVGNPNITTIRMRVRPLTWAEQKSDASRILEAIEKGATFSHDANNRWVASCPIPTGDFGTVNVDATQCNVRIDVPAPEGSSHAIQAIARFGDVYLNRLQSNAATTIEASGIEVQGFQLRGNVHVDSYYADVEVEPRGSGNVFVGSESDDWYYVPSLSEVEKRDENDGAAKFGATLRLPKDFTTQRITIASRGAVVETFGFPDVVSGAPRGTQTAFSSQSITVTANQGNATLLVLGESITTSRTGDFETDNRTPWTESQP